MFRKMFLLFTLSYLLLCLIFQTLLIQSWIVSDCFHFILTARNWHMSLLITHGTGNHERWWIVFVKDNLRKWKLPHWQIMSFCKQNCANVRTALSQQRDKRFGINHFSFYCLSSFCENNHEIMFNISCNGLLFLKFSDFRQAFQRVYVLKWLCNLI